MKRAARAVSITLFLLLLLESLTIFRADGSAQPLAFSQDWSSTDLITTDDDWSGVPGIIGYRGDGLASAAGVDPQTILADGSGTPVDVNANENDPNTFNIGGVAEFQGISNPVIALQGSGTARAPHIVISLNTTGHSDITICYNLRDIDGSADNAVQAVALQFRTGATGSFTNIPAGFVPDATTGPGQATLVTPVTAVLPATADNRDDLQVRIITSDAAGSDEWVGIDDIQVKGSNGEIIFDSATVSGQFDTTGSITALEWPHTIGSGLNRALIVGISTSTAGAVTIPGERVVSVTYNGTALTRIGSQIAPDLRSAVEMFILVAPPEGTASINVALVGVNYAVGGASSFRNVAQGMPTGPFTSNAASSGMPTVDVSSDIGEVVIDTVATTPEALITVSGPCQAERWNGQGFFSGSFSIGGGSTEFGSASVTMSWPQTVSGAWAIGAVSLKSPQAPTLARIDRFSATEHDGDVLIRWETDYEVDNLGFNIYRDQAESRARINPDIIAGSAFIAPPGTALGAGLSYSWTDVLPKKARDAQYWLEDIDLNGHSTWHGPFAVESSNDEVSTTGTKHSPLLNAIAHSSWPHSSLSFPVEPAADIGKPSLRQLAVQPAIASAPAVKIAVKQAGFYRISQPQLLAAGLSHSADPRLLQLFVNGQQIPIIVSGQQDGSLDPSDFIEFFATGLNSQFSSLRIYFLTVGSQPGLRINPASSSSSGKPLPPAKDAPKKALPSSASFPFAVERRDKIFFFSSLLNGEDDNFFGSVISSAPLDQSLTLSNIDFASASDASIEISLQGLTLAPHLVAVSLNDQSLGSISFADRDKGSLSLSVPHSLLREGENLVRLSRQAGSSDVSLVEFIRIQFSHTFKADSDSLFLTASPSQQLSISGFSTPAVRLFDVTDPDHVSQLASSVSPDSQGGFSISATIAAKTDRRLYAVADSQLRQPEAVTPNIPSNLRSSANGANLIIITRSDLISSLAPLKSYRQGRGLSVSIVDVEDIYDEFAFGHKTPYAIREFLQFTQSWKKSPRYVLLAGDGTYDPRNHVGGGAGDVVPIKLVETETMETASDDWYVDFNQDALLDIAIGRLPVRTPEEASRMIDKIISYEQGPPASAAVLVSDGDDGFGFEAATGHLRQQLPPQVKATEIYRSRVGDAAAKTRLIEAINVGHTVVNYFGHGTLSGWRGGVLTASDAASLNNSRNLSLFMAMTCLNGLFHNPTGDSLAEALMKADGAAVAVWASSGLTGPREQAVMNREAMRLVFGVGATTIGEVTKRAKSVISDRNIRRTWILFGDPATRIR